MLKISEMAQLADTTRRTLIFYDESGFFKPAQITEAGYRYYDYSQLYDLIFILGMRNLGLSVKEIKALPQQNEQAVIDKLTDVQSQIDERVNKLQRMQKVVTQKLAAKHVATQIPLNQPIRIERPVVHFLASRNSAGCTEEEVAELFSEFYQQLDVLAVMDATTSGFATNLPECQAEAYMDADFRVIKEATEVQPELMALEKLAGEYVSIRVENTTEGIIAGLSKLRQFYQVEHLKISDQLWQINDDDTFVFNGASKYGWLEYQII